MKTCRKLNSTMAIYNRRKKVKTKVYDCEGESLGGEWVNLASTEEATKEAVLQILYLDATIKAQLETADRKSVV